MFDSDVMLKPGVHAALARLKGFLESRGADVALIYLPSAAGAAKQGVDDFLAAGHTVDDVLELATRELRQLDGPAEEEESRDENGASQATLLVELSSSAELFHDEKADAYAAIEVDGHWETWSTRSTAFRRWLAHRFHLTYGKSPRTASIGDALTVIEGKAQFDGEQRQVWTRVARGEDENIYLDLGDLSWQAVRITPSGWSIEARPSVHFRRGQTNAALPIPVSGGSIDDLRQLINLGSEEDFQLIVGWLIGCLRPEGPYPVLAFVAEQGSGKSASARFLRSLVDPSPVPLRGMTRDERDLVIAARANHVVALDNVSHLPQWLSDALCRMATGAGWTTRRLYTDADEEVFSQSRPVLLTGIEDYVSNGDLLDRTILVNLPTIAPQNRRQEADLDRQFNLVWPRLLGALLDGVVCALRTIGTVRLTALPRMADFAAWVTASEAEFGWPAGSFLAIYMERANTAQEIILESSLLSDPLRSLAESTAGWQGTASELLEALASRVTEDVKRSKTWPRTARGLSGALRRLAPTLRTVGVEVFFDREGDARRRRLIRLCGATSETTVHTVQTVQEWESDAASLDEVDGMDGPIPIYTETDQFDLSVVAAPAQRELAWAEEFV